MKWDFFKIGWFHGRTPNVFVNQSPGEYFWALKLAFAPAPSQGWPLLKSVDECQSKSHASRPLGGGRVCHSLYFLDNRPCPRHIILLPNYYLPCLFMNMIIFTIDKNLELFVKKILAIFSNVLFYIIIDLKKINIG